MNFCGLKGRLVADPETRYTGDGKPVCSFRIAVDRAGKNFETGFFNVTSFGKTAEFIGSNFTKGKEIIITGGLLQDSYQTKSGENRYEVKVMADRAEFVGPKEQAEQATAADPFPAPTPAAAPKSSQMKIGEQTSTAFAAIDDDDFPF